MGMIASSRQSVPIHKLVLSVCGLLNDRKPNWANVTCRPSRLMIYIARETEHAMHGFLDL